MKEHDKFCVILQQRLIGTAEILKYLHGRADGTGVARGAFALPFFGERLKSCFSCTLKP